MEANSYVPFPLLGNAHLMTMVPAVWPRTFKIVATAGERRLFEVEPGSRVMAVCHWQSNRRTKPTLLILHGMEGCSESHHVLGLAEKAFFLGMNAIRMNMRSCGGTADLTPTLYNGGMSHDVLAVARELKEKDGLDNILLAGCSLGGNIVLKAAAELGHEDRNLIAAVCAVSPSIDLALSVEKLQEGFNRFYQQRFLTGLKIKLKEKHGLFPDLYDLGPLAAIRTIREFDETYTAPNGGFGTADNYYKTCSALPILDKIRVPTLIIHAQDDPFVPFNSFLSDKLKNPSITLLAPEYGGHGGFLQRDEEEPDLLDRFWAENRVVTFCMKNAPSRGAAILRE